MQIVDKLLESWEIEFIEESKSIVDQNKKNIQELTELEAKYKNVLLQGNQLSDIYEFMDFISVSKDLFPFQYDFIYEEKNSLDRRKFEINEKLEKNGKLILSYKSYLDRINKLKSNDNQGLNDRGVEKILVSNIEFYMDLYILQKKAIKKYKSIYYFPNESKYGEILNLFSTENMKRCGHPDRDDALQDNRIELINAICRVSWEWEYLNQLKGQLELYKPKMFSLNTEYHKLKKKIKTDAIVLAWESDIRIIEKIKDADSFSYVVYKTMLPEDTKRKLERMIWDIKYGK